MLVTMDLTLSLDAELAALLADYDAFLVAQDPLADDGFDDDGFDDEGAEDVTDDLDDDSGEVTDETGEAPPVDEETLGEDTTGEAPPVDGETVDQDPGSDQGNDPADVSEEIAPDLGPQVDFALAPDELAFDLEHALQVGRKLGGEFFDFA